MANKELMVTLGLDTSSYAQNVKRAKDLTKELDSSWKMLSSSSEKFEEGIKGLGKKQEYINQKIKVANGLTEVYSKRLKESQKALKETSEESEILSRKVKALSVALNNTPKDSKSYNILSKQLKSNTQLLDKAEKAIAVYNRRILEAKNGYNETQSALQKMNRELKFTDEKIGSLKADEKLDASKKSASNLKHEFEVLRNSTLDFDKSMYGLTETEKHYNALLKETKNQMKIYSQEMQSSKTTISSYEKSMETLQKEILVVEHSLREMNSTDEGFDEKRKKAESLREEFSSLSAKVEFHKDRLQNLSKEYKTSELEVSRLSKALKVTKLEMKELAKSVDFKENKEQLDQFANQTLELLQQRLKETKKSFDILKNSVSDFGKNAKDLKIEQQHLNEMLELTDKSILEYSESISKVEKELNKTIGAQKRQVTYIEKLQKGLDELKNDSKAWDVQRERIEKAKLKYEEITQKVTSYKEKLSQLKSEQAALENESVKLNGALDKNSKALNKMRTDITFKPLTQEIKELKDKGIESLEKSLSSLEKDFNLFTSSAKDFEKSLTGLGEKEKFLNQSLEISNKLLKEYSNEIKTSEKVVNDLSKEQKRLEEEILKSIESLKKLDGQSLDKQKNNIKILEEEYEKVNKELDLHKKKLDTANKNYDSSRIKIGQLTSEIGKTKNQISELNRQTFFEGLDNKIKNINSSIKLLDSEFELAASKVKKFAKTTEGLNAKIDTNVSKLKLLDSEFMLNSAKLEENKKHLADLKQEQEVVGKSIDELKNRLKGLDENSPKYEQTLVALTRLEAEFKELNKDVSKFETENKNLQSDLNKTTTKVNNLIKATSELNKNFVSDKFKDFGEKSSKAGNKIQSAGQSMIGASASAGLFQGAIVKTGLEFQKSMSNIRAITAASDDDFAKLTETARKMGAETVFTATQSADAMGVLALAGLDTNQIVGSIPSVLALAEAGAMSLSDAAELATSSISSLGYVGDEAIEKMPEYLDKVARAATRSHTNIEQLMQAYNKCGGQLDNLKIGLDTSASMLGVLANRGIYAEAAGTSLNSILINLTQRSGESAKAMQELGVSAFDSNGQVRDIEEVIKDLAKALHKLPKKDQVQLINMIGGKTQAKTLQKLLQGMVTDTGELSDEYKNLKKEIEEAPNTEALQTMATTMTDNLYGDIELLKSQVEESFNALFDKIEPRLRTFVQNLTKWVKKVTDAFLSLPEPIQNFILISLSIVTGLAPVLMILGSIATGLGAISSAIGGVIKLLPSFGKSAAEAADNAKKLESASEELAETIPTLGEKLANFGSKISNFIKFFGNIISKVGEFSLKFGGFLLKWIKRVPELLEVIGEFGGSVLEILAPIGEALMTGIEAIGTVLGAVFSVEGLTVIAIAAAIAAAIYGIYKAVKYLYDNWSDISKGISDKWTSCMQTVSNWIDSGKNKFNEFKEYICQIGKNINDYFKGLLNRFKKWFKLQILILKYKLSPDRLKGIFEDMIHFMVGLAGQLVGNMIAGIMILGKEFFDCFEGIKGVVIGFAEILKGVFTLDWDKISEGASKVWDSIWTLAGKTLENLWVLITGTIENLVKYCFGIDLTPFFNKIKDWFINFTTWLLQWGADRLQDFSDWLSQGISNFLQWCDESYNSACQWFDKCLQDFSNWCDNLEQSLKDWCVNTWNDFLEWCSNTQENFNEWCDQAEENFVQWCANAKESIINWCKETWESFIEWKDNLIASIKQWCTDAYNSFLQWCSDAKQALIQFWRDFSADPIGYLETLASNIRFWLINLFASINNWFSQMLSRLSSWFNECIAKTRSKLNDWAQKFGELKSMIVSKLSELPQVLYNIGSKMISKLWEGFKSNLSWFGQNVAGAVSHIMGQFTSAYAIKPELQAPDVTESVGTSMSSTNIGTGEGLVVGNLTTSSGKAFANVGQMFNDVFKSVLKIDDYKTSGGFYKPKSITKPLVENQGGNREIIDALIKQNQLLMQILASGNTVEVGLNVDGRQIAKASARYMNDEISKINRRKTRLGGAF